MGLYVQDAKRYFGLNNLDEKLEKYLNFDNGYFVELGANNGVHQSNTLYFEKYRGWRGGIDRANPSQLSDVSSKSSR